MPSEAPYGVIGAVVLYGKQADESVTAFRVDSEGQIMIAQPT